LILISFSKPEESLFYYKKRWQIETLFKAFKSSGFNIENTHVTDPKRLEKLFMIVIIALVWCYKTEDYFHSSVKKIKKHRRKTLSIFKYGLNHITNILLKNNKALIISYLQFFIMCLDKKTNRLEPFYSRFLISILGTNQAPCLCIS